MATFCANPDRFAQFVAYDAKRRAVGLIEVAARGDYVNGTRTSPVAFLEGIYVVPDARRRGVARELVACAERWASSLGIREFASDARIENEASHAMHRHLGFGETERVVYFRKDLGPNTPSAAAGAQAAPLAGKIIVVNGASSAGKSTLCRALQASLDQPFWHFSIDHLRAAGILPAHRIDAGDFAWHDLRPAFFEGFHRCLPALALAGNNLLVEHIVETRAWMSRLLRLLEPFDVFFVGIHCPLDELERRERQRGDRRAGEARQDFGIVHTFGTYDAEVDATQPLAANVNAVQAAWRARTPPAAFATMLAAERRSMQNGR